MWPRLARASLLALLVACALAAPAGAATFTVNDTVDNADVSVGNGECDADSDAPVVCTLRAAVQEANANLNDPDVINVPAGTYLLDEATGPESAATFDLDVLGPTTIVGAGARGTIVNANRIDRVFEIGPITIPPVVSISGLTIRGGAATTPGGAGIRVSQGSLTLTDSVVRDNGTAGPSAQGGGIYNLGSLTVDRSLLTDNDSGASNAGGALYHAGGSFTIRTSTISDNHGESGGALTDTASTGTRSVAYSTIYGNQSDGGGAVERFSAGTQIRDSIVANNTPTNCSGALTSQGRNIESGRTCGFTAAGDRQLTNPLVGALANNGGPTDTHRPLGGSPAIDSAANEGCPPLDQRGLPRPRSVACDIGAVELQPPPPPPPPPARPAFLTLTPATARRRPGADNVVTATVRNNDGTVGAFRTVRYSIAGPNEGAGAVITDASGVARISWDGVREGPDTVTAFVDADGNGLHDALVEPLARATVTWALPRPRQGRTVNMEPLSGIVRFRVPPRRSRARGKVGAAGSTSRWRRLTEARQLPLRAVVDTRRGRVQMTAVRGVRSLQTGQFYGGVFTTRQSRRGRRPFTELRLTEQLRCVRGNRSRLQASRHRRSRRLWGRVRRRGRFRTRGRYSTAAVRGTVWLQKDSCDTTLTVVREGVVAVRDFARRKTVRVKAGRRYVARRARRR